MEGSGCGLIEGTVPTFAGVTEENVKNPQSR
jgi:hypothetical protein